MVTLTQAEYDKFKDIMCAYFDVDGGELPKSFEKDLFERDIIQICVPDYPKLTKEVLDELCTMLETTIQAFDVYGIEEDVVPEFRRNVEHFMEKSEFSYEGMIYDGKQCTVTEYLTAKYGESS